MNNNKTSGVGERIAIPSPSPSPRCEPSEDAGEQDQIQVAAAIDSNGILSIENYCSPEQWSRQLSCPHHLFPKGATHREISDYLDEIKLSNEHKLEILDGLFG